MKTAVPRRRVQRNAASIASPRPVASSATSTPPPVTACTRSAGGFREPAHSTASVAPISSAVSSFDVDGHDRRRAHRGQAHHRRQADAAAADHGAALPRAGAVAPPHRVLCAVWRSAGARPGQRGAVIGCGGVGLSAVMGLAAVGASPIVAVDIDGAKLETALEMGATDAVEWGRLPGSHRGACAGCDRRRRRRRARGHGPRRGDAGGVPLHPPPRHRGLHRHPPGGHRGAPAGAVHPPHGAAGDRRRCTDRRDPNATFWSSSTSTGGAACRWTA